MLRAAPMSRVLILVPGARVDAVVEAVAALGVLHLLDLSGRAEWSPAVRPYDVDEATHARRETLRRIDAIVRFFAPPAPPPCGAADLPPLDAVERAVAEWSAAMEELRAERQRLDDERAELDRALGSVTALAPIGVQPGELAAMRMLEPACGWLAAGDLARIEEVLSRIQHRTVVTGARGNERLVLVFVLARDREALDRALRSTGWIAVELPTEGASGRGDLAAVEAAIAETKAKLRGLDARIAEQAAHLAGPLAAARAVLERDLLLLEARACTSRSESVVFIAGWIPTDRAPALREAVSRATGARSHMVVEEPLSIDVVRSGAEPVPILFRNPAWIRPFEQLVAAYGAPRWRELDPTPIVAVSFCLMFGLMFGDVGQGLVLAGVGWGIFWRAPRWRDYGVILMECGLSAAAFGLAYGSVFGLENLLPALWFRPMQDVPRLLRVGVGFGLVFLSLSFGLSILNTVLRREWMNVLFASHGLLAALAYWIAAALGLRWLATGELGVTAGIASALLGVPLFVWWLVRVMRAVWPSRASEEARPDAASAILGAAVELVDFAVRGVANTVSFVRLAAFAVSHAGLLLAVFALAGMVSASRFGTLGGALVIVVGNLVIIALEGLIVSIQSVRLVYYEFFSHFHEGSGLEYRPLELRTATGWKE